MARIFVLLCGIAVVVADPVRVSFSECNIEEPTDRLDCGYFGIQQEECSSRGCCWQPSDLPGVNWCYHSKSQSTPECTSVRQEEKRDCGYYGIHSEECTERGCCWMPSEHGADPWCFFSNSDHRPSTTAAPERNCGKPAIQPSLNSRIVGGEDAVPNSWPWQASLQRPSGSHFCGGSLINERWIVSAAHCAPSSPDDVVVVLGAFNKDITEETQVRYNVEGIFVIPSWNESAIDNDIMLLKLDQAVDFNDVISPVCMPTADMTLQPDRVIQTTGWGTLEFMGETPSRLQQLNLPVVDNDVCAAQEYYTDRITDNMICAGYMEGGKGSCHGDSGGPLVAQQGGYWTLYGAVSWGYPCAVENHPTLYAKVINYLDWIDETMAAN